MTKKLAVCYVVLEVSSVISVYVSVHSVVHMNINIIDRTHTHTVQQQSSENSQRFGRHLVAEQVDD